MIVATVLPLLSVVFLTLAVLRIRRDGGRIGPASRTWLLIALFFGGVGLWLWLAPQAH